MEYFNPMIRVEWMVFLVMEQRVVTHHSVCLGQVMAFDVEHITCGTISLSRQVLGLQHLSALIVAWTRVVTLVTLRIVTFPRLLKFSMTLVLIPFGVRTFSGPFFRGQVPVGAYERNAL